MKRLLAYAELPASLTGVAALFTSAQATTPATGNDKRAEEEFRRLSTVEVEALLSNEPKAMAHVWSDDMAVTNPLNKIVNKQQVLRMVETASWLSLLMTGGSNTPVFMVAQSFWPEARQLCGSARCRMPEKPKLLDSQRHG